MSDTEALAQELKNALDAVTKAEGIITTLMRQDDNRNFQDVVLEVTGHSPQELRSELIQKYERAINSYQILLYVLHLKDLEAIRGKGEWREIVSKNNHLVRGVTSLREHHPELNHNAACNIVEAYLENRFD